VFTLTRKCLSVSGGCRIPLGPLKSIYLDENCFHQNPNTSTLRKFSALHDDPEEYRGLTRLGKRDKRVFHDYVEISEMVKTDQNRRWFDRFDQQTYLDDPFWKLCVATTPWLSVQSFRAEYGIFCSSRESSESDGSAVLLSIGDANSSPLDGELLVYPDLHCISFMTSDQLEVHMAMRHSNQAEEDVGEDGWRSGWRRR
jgi:hypothetical protein